MGWVIHNGFITSDNRAIGSIVKVGTKWLVEILWSGPTGDIKFEAENITAALAFIKGVEKLSKRSLGAKHHEFRSSTRVRQFHLLFPVLAIRNALSFGIENKMLGLGWRIPNSPKSASTIGP